MAIVCTCCSAGDDVNFYKLRDVYGQVDTYFDGSAAQSHYMSTTGC